jgi:hypothetical protein
MKLLFEPLISGWSAFSIGHPDDLDGNLPQEHKEAPTSKELEHLGGM